MTMTADEEIRVKRFGEWAAARMSTVTGDSYSVRAYVIAGTCYCSLKDVASSRVVFTFSAPTCEELERQISAAVLYSHALGS